ncbi:hypothetical protein [Pseudorhodoplanes sp.]
MTILKKAVLAASVVAVIGVSVAHASSRAELDSGYHGNTPAQTRSNR